ncbi:dihydrolipoamide acetyltransferase family protein [Cecembia sp.]|uniref:dihydrolipoamide acetyltransferase family protein n=1 Tax=Cecembia sp. TaxID=1898110 RepID=UPI0025C0CA60|nr:dihydrolipoamide acetyltransferase family protein [Cecembia sp.]
MISFKMPSLGADMEDGTLVEWRKQPGDLLKRGDIIADVDTQKGLIEIEFFGEGILEKHLVAEGEKIPVGTVMALIRGESDEITEEIPQENIPDQEKMVEPAKVEEGKIKVPAASPQKAGGERVRISPLAKKIAETHQLDISKISGTGPDGAIVKADIDKCLREGQEKKAKAKTDPIVTEPRYEPESKLAIPESEAIRKAVAAAMSRSNQDIPHYYLEKRIDFSKAMLWLKEANKERSVQQRLLPVALMIKAVAKALDDVPDLNAVWEDGLERKNEINIGFVVSLRTGGIMLPAILNADTLSVDGIMEKLNDLIPRARAFKLRSSELSKSTFTITSIGEGGADKVYGVIYPPQVGIVGFGEIRDEAIVAEGMIGIKPVVDVTLAADHRATDGLIGSKFLASLNKYLQNPENL